MYHQLVTIISYIQLGLLHLLIFLVLIRIVLQKHLQFKDYMKDYVYLKMRKKISLNVLLCDNMKIHRSQTKTTGEIIGYRFGLKETAEVIDELKARYYLFIKPYEEMLSRKEQKALLETLKEKLDSDPNLRLVLVDAKIPNPDWKNLEQDISHCPLIRDMLSKKWPKWEEPEKGDDEEEDEDVEEEEEDDDEEMADNTEDGDEESEEDEEGGEDEESEESDE
mmetsp:Transcript_34208/g.74127  ORF Transcript_34208/g.74127 Transcript_34208/m.74127 type:complete len:222 (-) Transcript_34208:49-714(-)